MAAGEHTHEPDEQPGTIELQAASDGKSGHVHMRFPSTFMCMSVQQAMRLGINILRTASDARALQAVNKMAELSGLTDEQTLAILTEIVRR